MWEDNPTDTGTRSFGTHLSQKELDELLEMHARSLGARGPIRIEYAFAQKMGTELSPIKPTVNANLHWYDAYNMPEKPEIVCLCGSTRFYEQFMEVNYILTMEGKIVLSVGFFHHRSDSVHGQKVGCTNEQKFMLDELHKRKIDLADTILVINVDGYVGESTRSEIEYAKERGKKIIYLCEKVKDGE